MDEMRLSSSPCPRVLPAGSVSVTNPVNQLARRRARDTIDRWIYGEDERRREEERENLAQAQVWTK